MIVKNQPKALALGISTILMWSTVPTAFKLTLASITPIQLIACGFSLASLILGLYMCLSGKFKEIKTLRKKDIINIIGQGFSLFVYYFFLFSAYANLPAQITQPINNTWAFVLVFLNAWIAKEMLNKGEITGMLFAYTGAIVIGLGGASSEAFAGEINAWGLFSAVACTFFMALYWVINNRCEAVHIVSLWGGFFISALIAICIVLIQSPSWDNFTLHTFSAVSYLAFFEWALPFTTWTLALKYTTSMPTMGTLSFFNPFLSLLWINLILGEEILITTFAGLLLIVAGMVVQQRSKKVTIH